MLLVHSPNVWLSPTSRGRHSISGFRKSGIRNQGGRAKESGPENSGPFSGGAVAGSPQFGEGPRLDLPHSLTRHR